jgi:long-chain acyl-CoA synthetase
MQTEISRRINQVMGIAPDSNLIEFQSHWYSWRQIGDFANTLEKAFIDCNLNKGDVVGVLLRNRPGHIAALIQLLTSGRCIATINPFQHPDKIAEDITNLSVKAVICDTEDAAQDSIMAAAKHGQTHLLEIDAVGNLAVRIHHPAACDSRKRYHDALTDTCILMLTSGTTGPAKRIKLPYKNFEQSLLGNPGHYSSHNESNTIRLKETPAILTTPLVHIGGMHGIMAALCSARPVVVLEKFNVEDLRRALIEHRPKLISLPPAALKMLLDADVPKHELASLLAVRSGSAPLPTSLQDSFEDTYGIPILDAYGATEFAGAVAGWTLADHKQFGRSKRGSVGRAQPGTQIRIVNRDTGQVIGKNTVGVLQVISPQINNPEWTSTTDLAEIDDDGFLFIRGRTDDAIIRGGFKIQPSDVSYAICTHPAVFNACVVGIDDERLGQVPVAVVELKKGIEGVSRDELISYLRSKLVAYQIPVALRFVESLPRTPSMKISRHEVKALFSDKTEI